ncbi:MAG: hypothetical protein AB3N23_01650 [Paracoccaceae bacterium]
MSQASRSNLVIGLLAIAFSALALFAWIPLDTETGLIEKVRRQITVGDALAPSVAAVFVGVGGLLLVVFERRAPNQPVLSTENLLFVLRLLVVIAIALLTMRFAGPAIVWLANVIQGTELEYRLLRDTVPWKYLGFLMGGTIMVFGMISVVEGQLRLRLLFISIAAVLAVMFVYDVPFEDLLLPPNGDV